MNTLFLLVEGWVFLGLAAAVFAQTGFQNGTFNSPGLSNGQPALALPLSSNTFITGWTTAPGFNGAYSGSVEYLGDRSQDPAGYCVELGYYLGINAIQQTFGTAPNQPYQVSFWLATDCCNGPPALMRVSAGGTFADYQAPAGSGDERAMGWQLQSFSFISDHTGSTTLWFGNIVGVPAVDTITVIPVPEPGAWGLFGLGALITLLAVRYSGRVRPEPDARGMRGQTTVLPPSLGLERFGSMPRKLRVEFSGAIYLLMRLQGGTPKSAAVKLHPWAAEEQKPNS